MESKCILEQAEKEAQSIEYRMTPKEHLTEKTGNVLKKVDQECLCKESLYNLFHQISTHVNQINLKFRNDIVTNIEEY